MKHPLFVLPLSLCLLLCGCTSGSSDQTPDVYARLSKLKDQASTDVVKDCFDLMMNQTIEGYDKAYQISSHIEEPSVIEQGSKIEAVKRSQDTVVMQWMDEDKALYQVLRNGTVDGIPPYVGLVRMDKAATTTISANLADPHADVFASPLDLTVQYISTQENNALKDLSAEQIGYRLTGEELNLLTPYFGSDAAVAPYSNPRLYSFETEQDQDTLTFTITLKDPDAYNSAAKEKDPARADILHGAKLPGVAASTKSMSWKLVMNPDGVIQQARMMTEETVEKDGKSVCLQISRQAKLCGCASNQDKGLLQDLFGEADSGKLRQGSSFSLDLPIRSID